MDICGSGSVVERHLAKVNVASSNLVFRFIVKRRKVLRLLINLTDILICSAS